MRRVVITGVGPVSAVGIGKESFFNALRNGVAGIRRIAAFDVSGLESTLAAEIAGFRVDDYLKTPKTYLDRSSELAFAAMSLALKDADLQGGDERGRVACLLGTAYGSLGTMDLFFEDFVRKGPRLVKPFLFPHSYANTAISLLAIEYGIRGFHTAFSSGHVSAGCALLYAGDLIRQGRADVVIAGGVEALNRPLFKGYAGMGLLSRGNGAAEGCFPFDRRRNGMVLGEGGGMLVIEELEHARNRGARVYGEIAGGAMFSEPAGASGESSDGSAIAMAMAAAMREAGVGAGDVDYVSAGAHSSPLLDAREARAMGSVFSARGARPAVGSIKSMIGETIGAAGALQAIAAAAALETDVIPHTVNLEDPDPGSDLDFVMKIPRRTRVNRIVMNSIDPGGAAVTLVVRRVEA